MSPGSGNDVVWGDFQWEEADDEPAADAPAAPVDLKPAAPAAPAPSSPQPTTDRPPRPTTATDHLPQPVAPAQVQPGVPPPLPSPAKPTGIEPSVPRTRPVAAPPPSDPPTPRRAPGGLPLGSLLPTEPAQPASPLPRPSTPANPGVPRPADSSPKRQTTFLPFKPEPPAKTPPPLPSSARPTPPRPAPVAAPQAVPATRRTGETVDPARATSHPGAKSLVRGQRAKLAELGLGTNFEVAVALGLPTGRVVDVSCLGLDSNGRLSDDRYFTFYNHLETPCGGVTLLARAGTVGAFHVQLDRLPASITRLIVAATFDGPGEMRELGPSRALWRAETGAGAEFAFAGRDFSTEKALMLLEIYRKDGGWRTAALGQGFAGGLGALLTHFGAQVNQS